MSNAAQAENQFSVVDKTKEVEKPTHYLNVQIVDADGNKVRINTGIALGGKNEKGLSPALIQNFIDNPDYEYQLVGTIRSAEPEVKSLKF